MASSQMKFYGLLGAIAAVGIALIGYVATRPDPGATPVTIDSTARPLAIGDLVPLEAARYRSHRKAESLPHRVSARDTGVTLFPIPIPGACAKSRWMDSPIYSWLLPRRILRKMIGY